MAVEEAPVTPLRDGHGQDGFSRVLRRAKRDLLGYVSEYVEPFKRFLAPRMNASVDAEQTLELERLRMVVDGNTIVIYKMEGCGYCKRAEELLAGRGMTFSSVVGSAPQTKAALGRTLRVPIVMFPVIFVQGVFLGGSDQLSEALDSGLLPQLVASPRRPFPSGVFDMPDPIQLLSGPRGQPWWSFQLHVYANYVRLVSSIHVCIFALAIFFSGISAVISLVLLGGLTIDMAIFTLLGPTPLAPLSTCVTVVLWRFRGAAVTSLPYKAVMGVFYVFVLTPIILKRDVASAWSKGQITGLLVNSLLLAILRF